MIGSWESKLLHCQGTDLTRIISVPAPYTDNVLSSGLFLALRALLKFGFPATDPREYQQISKFTRQIAMVPRQGARQVPHLSRKRKVFSIGLDTARYYWSGWLGTSRRKLGYCLYACIWLGHLCAALERSITVDV